MGVVYDYQSAVKRKGGVRKNMANEGNILQFSLSKWILLCFVRGVRGKCLSKEISMSGTLKSVTERARKREYVWVCVPPTGRNYSHPMITLMNIKVNKNDRSDD